jgi:DNA-binding protein YbaB
MILAALNEANRKADEDRQAAMSKLTGSMNVGGLL